MYDALSVLKGKYTKMIEAIMRNLKTEAEVMEILNYPNVEFLMPGVKLLDKNEHGKNGISLSKLFDCQTPEYNEFSEFLKEENVYAEGTYSRKIIDAYLGKIFGQSQLLSIVSKLMSDNNSINDEITTMVDFLTMYARTINGCQYYALIDIALCGAFEFNKYYDQFMIDNEDKLKLIPSIASCALSYMNLKSIFGDNIASDIVYSVNSTLIMYNTKEKYGFVFNDNDDIMMQQKIKEMLDAAASINTSNFEKCALIIDDASATLASILFKYAKSGR